MTDWKKQQAECRKCLGTGYFQSEMRHMNGRQPHAWVVLCECQPKTLPELEEAAAQEAALAESRQQEPSR